MWMGIDVGTGGTRALLVDAQGRVAASFTAMHEDILMQRPLWAEQRPENWWDAARIAIRGALAQAGVTGSQVTGIGLSGQMHGLVILDAGQRRDPPRADLVRSAQPGAGGCHQPSRRPRKYSEVHRQSRADRVSPCPSFYGCAIMNRKHFERVRHLLLPKDYLRFQLTGEYASDVSDASGTSLFDVVARRWSCEMMDAARSRSRHPPHLLRIERRHRTRDPCRGRSHRTGGRHARGRRGRRSGLQRSRQRHCRIRHRLLHPGHLRRGLRPYGARRLRSSGPRPHFLPCRAR